MSSEDSSCMNSERSVGSEWILCNPVIDNPIYDFFEEEVPPSVPIFDTEDHTYTYLIHASWLTKPINYSALPKPTTGAHNDKRETPTKHNQDAAAPSPAATTLPEKRSHHVATQHVIIVETGEDVVEEILSLAKSGSKSVYIESATGKLSTVALHKTSTPSEATTRYKGLFDIVSLTGSYTRDEIEGMCCWTGGLQLSTTADGIAFEGSVAGELIAASPVQEDHYRVLVNNAAEITIGEEKVMKDIKEEWLFVAQRNHIYSRMNLFGC